MKKVTFLLLALFFTKTLCFCQSHETDSLKLNWKYYKLSNGLQVILQPDLNRQEASIEFWIHAGTRNEPPGKYGLAHFSEHATPYGLPGDTEGQARLKIYRTNSNAQTRKDYSRYYIQVKPEGLEIGLKYSADRLRADTSVITDELIEKHRKNVLGEIDRNSSSPFWGAKATSVREAGTFGKANPYGHSVYGTRQENIDLSAQDVKQWYDEHFFASNTILFVVGNFGLEKAKVFIEKYFENIHRRKGIINSKAVPAKHSFEKATIICLTNCLYW